MVITSSAGRNFTNADLNIGPKTGSKIKLKTGIESEVDLVRDRLEADHRRLEHQAKNLVRPRLPIATTLRDHVATKKSDSSPQTSAAVGAASPTQRAAPSQETRLAAGQANSGIGSKTSVSLNELLPLDKNEMSQEDWQKFLKGELYPDFWKNLKANLEAQGMDVSAGVILVSNHKGRSINSISFKQADGDLSKGRDYSLIYIHLDEQGYQVEKVKNINPHIAYESLFFNPDVQLSEDVLQEAALTLFEKRFMQGLERIKKGWPELSREEFRERLKTTPFASYFEKLRAMRPELKDLDLVLVSRPVGTSINSISFKQADGDFPKGSQYSQVYIHLDEQGCQVERVEKMNPHIAYESLFFNPDVQLSEDVLQEAALALVEKRFMQGLERSSVGWPELSREEFSERLKTTPFASYFEELRAMRPGLKDLDLVLVTVHRGTSIMGIGFKQADSDLYKGSHYSHIHIHLDEQGCQVERVEKINPHIAYETLFFNPDVQLSEDVLQEAALVLIENRFMQGLERIIVGWPELSREEFAERLKTTPFASYFEELRALRPELTELDLVLASNHKGTSIKSISFKQKDGNLPKGTGYSQIYIHLDKHGCQVDKVENANPHIAYDSLFFNPDVQLSEDVLQEATLTLFEKRFMQGLERISKGWPELSLEEFRKRLKTTPFASYFGELRAMRPELTDLDLVLVSQHNGTSINGIGFKPVDSNLPNSLHYSHIHIHFDEQGVVVLSVAKKYKSLIYLTLTQNPELSIDPLLAIRMGSLSAEDRLLYRLSEQGRALILDELRREHFEDNVVDYDSESDHEVLEAVTSAEFQKAAYRVLVKLGVAFDASEPWEDRDPRYTIARELHYYLAGTPIPPEYATAVGDLLIAGEFRTRERELVDYRKVLRDAGKSPISESGWDDVFSVELRTRLREFANDYFNLVGIENPAQAYLRDPFNEALGAFYWEMYQEGNTAFKTEILIHLRYQQRRGDSLSEFYDGVQKQSGRERESAMALVQHDLKGLEEQHSLWQLNVEEPFRLINGIVGGAAIFLWGTVFDEVAQRSMIASARNMFPRHEFDEGSNLSELLPQNLFFEVVGQTAREETKGETHVPSFEEGIRKLQFLMGVGETTYGSFRRGFGEGSVLGLMSDIVDELMLKHPKEFREYLEGSWVYQRNEVNESGEYHKVEVEIRRGDLLEKLFQGYDLQAMTGRLREFPKIIRGFRLGEKNEAILMRRMQQAWEDYQFDGEMDVDDARLIAEQMSLWYLSPGIKAKKGDRWYLFEQWLKSKTDGGELLFDGVFEVVEEYL